jgi:hypothetical protein
MNSDKKVSFCDNCTKEGHGMALSEAEARIHRDNYPDHNIVTADIEECEL